MKVVTTFFRCYPGTVCGVLGGDGFMQQNVTAFAALPVASPLGSPPAGPQVPGRYAKSVARLAPMARPAGMLRDADSSPKHLSIVRRHMRLSKSVKGTEFLLAAIEPAYLRLVATLADKGKAVDADEDAQDDVELRGREAADLVRTTSERAKQHDRDAPGEGVFDRLLPEGGFSDFIASNGTVSPATSRLFAQRIRDLGASHPLITLAADHEARATASDDAVKTFENVLRARKLAEAEDELAQAALRKAYEANALDARKKFGKVAAERLFPRIRRRRPGNEDDGGVGEGSDGG